MEYILKKKRFRKKTKPWRDGKMRKSKMEDKTEQENKKGE